MLLASSLLPVVLALSDSSGTGDFLRQVSGLIAITCVAGILWLGLMALVLQRAAERKRRAAQGLEPLPSLPVALYRRLTGAGKVPRAAVSSAVSARPAVPLPDLSMLTGDLTMQSAPPPEPAPQPAMPVSDPAEPADTGTPPGPEPTPAPPAQDMVELLRVYRDLADGSLIVAIGDQTFRSLAELRSADLERRFQTILRDLEALAQPARPQGAQPSAAPETPTVDVPPARPPSFLRQMTRVAMGQTPETVELPPERSIAEQIEDLLQERLRGLSEFAGREIHVRPALSGGVTIEVDGVFYQGVGEVTDEAVRALLMEVVRAWEEGQ